MNTNFEPALAKVLTYEGGWSNDPHDPGGATYQGITQRTYDDYRRRNNLGARSVHYMAPSERDLIYRTEYWQPVGADLLAPGVDLCTFDASVNSGPRTALRWLNMAPKDPISAIKFVCAKRTTFLHGLRSWRYFGAGWTRRVTDVEVTALRWAGGTEAVHTAANEASAKQKTVLKKAAIPTVGGAAVTAGVSDHQYLVCFIGIAVTLITGIAIWNYLKHMTRASVLKKAVLPSLPVSLPAANALDQLHSLEQDIKASIGGR